jgi:hypothetical protein
MNSAAHLWSGTSEQAIQVLRDEWAHLNATLAAIAVCAPRPQRSEVHRATLASIPGSHATRLGVLLAAAPASKRVAITDAFEQVLSVEDAAKMRGVAAGTWYRFEAWIDGKRQPSKQVQTDDRGARLLARKAEQDAAMAGAQSVRIVFTEMQMRRAA